MDRKTKNLIFIYIGGVILLFSILLMSIGYYYFGFGILLAIFMANVGFSGLKDIEWNKGICKKYNEPWEFVEIVDYSDGSYDHYFKCRDEDILFNNHDLIRKTYKGKNKL